MEIPEINAVYTHMLGHDCHSIVAGADHADAMIAQLRGYIRAGFGLILTSHYTPEDLKDAETKIGYLEQLKAEGRIRYLGFSFHDSYEAFEEILCYRDWDFCQIQLNYMDTDSQAGMRGYRLTEERNVPLVIMEPVKGGSLAAFAEDITGRFRALDPEASAASYALRWVGSLPNVKVILSGMSTMGQVEDNLKTFSTFRPLSDEEANTIDEIVALIRSRVQNGCTACRYCMPCPAGVDIPGNFRVWNTYHMYQNYNMVKNNWENGLGDEKQAKNCVKCGKCEKACPQKLHIREDLEKVQADMDRKEYVIR